LSINHSRLAGYAFYGDDGRLIRALFINSQAYFKSTTSQRGSIHVDLDLGGSGAPSTMNVKRLSVPHADDTSGLTWGGQTYETADGRVSGDVDLESVNALDGIDVRDTEVVLLSFSS